MSSPPYRWPCYYGMDTGARSELLAANMDVAEIRTYLDVDTLAYLSLDALISATGASTAGFCGACLTGTYPVAIPIDLTVPVAVEISRPGAAVNPLVTDADRLFPAHQAEDR